ncbi:MAG TPA: hypothetical protein VER11_34675 [Polyangiaceae bacterium]|nr:hypothetical protein [Polyangiaceae bacterium]
MTTPDTCPDFGRPKWIPFGENPGERCASGRGPITHQLKCAQLTIARMRPVVEASTAWFHAPDEGIDRLAADLGLVAALDTGGFVPKIAAPEFGEAAPK